MSAPLLLWRKRPLPLDWEAEFGAPGPLELEIGFGDGRYTVFRALREPETRFVGLEISGASILRAMRRVRDAGLGNVRIVKVSAQFALRALFAPASLSSITVNFPDPWPKERHAANRLLQRSFFELAAGRLRPGGALKLATDHPDYLAFAVGEADSSGRYAVEAAEPPEAVFETKYALKWRAQGKLLHYRRFRLVTPLANPHPNLEREAMPHAVLSGKLPESLEFSKQVCPYADGHVILLELCRSLGGEHGARLLFRATVDEPDLQQGVLVAVRPKEEGGLVVSLESFGDPVITRTVKGAVHAVVTWLMAGVPGLRLEQASY
jgi:tRNA (guanine-N7-)-methyltransferase